MSEAYLVRFEVHEDARGALIVGECGLSRHLGVPFTVHRVFWIVNPHGQRGNHAHKACEQVIVPVAGSCRAVADGLPRRLWQPDWGLYVPAGVNVTLEDFDPGTVLLVLCSEHYSAEDFIFPPECGATCQCCQTATGGAEVVTCGC